MEIAGLPRGVMPVRIHMAILVAKSFFLSSLTLALSPRWCLDRGEGIRGKNCWQTRYFWVAAGFSRRGTGETPVPPFD